MRGSARASARSTSSRPKAKFTNYNWLGGRATARPRTSSCRICSRPRSTARGSSAMCSPTTGCRATRRSGYLKPNYQASIDVTPAWFGDPRNTAGFGLFSHRTSQPGIYIDKGYGATISFTRKVTHALAAQPRSTATSSREVEAGDVYFCVNYGVCEHDDDRTAAQSQVRSRRWRSTTSSDRTDVPLNPDERLHRAGRSRARVEVHALGFSIQSRHRRGRDVPAGGPRGASPRTFAGAG